MTPPTIDILICAHNEEMRLGRLLESLCNQTVDSSMFRVILVDNASTDATAQIPTRFPALQVTVVHEPRLSLNQARNTGYAAARAKYVAHTDADCAAPPHWIERILETISEHEPDLLGGPYSPHPLDPRPPWFRDEYNSMSLGGSAHWLTDREFLSGANMIWRASVVRALGGFGATIGLHGRGMARGDETHLQVRARRERTCFRAFYDPAIEIYHAIRPEDHSIRYWTRRFLSAGYGQSTVLHESPEKVRVRLALLPLAMMTAVGRATLGIGLRRRSRYPAWQNYWFERVLPEVYRVGRTLRGLRPSSR